mgnify:CR=1 FL=1
MKRLLGLLMVVGLMVGMSGCGKEIEVVKETQPFTGKLIEAYEVYRDETTNKPIRHGYYKSYRKDESYKEVGQYEDGKQVGEWSYFAENGEERKVTYKDGKKDRGEFWISVSIDSFWVETEDETPDDEKVFRGLFTYDDGLWNGLVVLYCEVDPILWTTGQRG